MERRPRLAALTAAVLVLVTAGSAAAAEPPAFVKGTCPVKLARGAHGVTCGTVAVPARYDRPDGAQLQIAVARLPAKRGPGTADPVMLLAGGPGEKLLQTLETTADAEAFTRQRRRDVVLVDQRGVGASTPALECPELTRDDQPDVTSALAACRKRLADDGVDLAAFTTQANARDLDRVRQALGLRRVNLYGASYGTLLGLTAMRGDPGWIRSVVLASPVPPQSNFVADLAPDFRRAVRALDAACRRDRTCRTRYGSPAATLDQLVTKLDARPAKVAGEPLTGTALATLAYSLFYAPNGPAALPSLLAQIKAGDLSALQALAGAQKDAPRRLTQPPVTIGMEASVLCAEVIPRVDAARTGARAQRSGPAARAVFATTPLVGAHAQDACQAWDVPALPAAAQPVTSAIPTLLVTGALDQITPPAYGALAARTLSRAQLVTAAAAGHSPFGALGACGRQIMEAFLDRPGTEVDAACARRAPRFISAG